MEKCLTDQILFYIYFSKKEATNEKDLQLSTGKNKNSHRILANRQTKLFDELKTIATEIDKENQNSNLFYLNYEAEATKKKRSTQNCFNSSNF